MSAPSTPIRTAVCACGRVAFEAAGAPIAGVVCHCDDCQEAGRRIQALPKAAPIQDPDGGTAYVLYRKDRVRCIRGAALLQRHKLSQTSPTNRMVATCCNSAMILNFDDAKHWVDLYRTRMGDDAPPPQMRVCTKSKLESGAAPDGVPRYGRYPARFLARLLAVRIEMMLGR